jgi:hypothetical protein
MLMATDPVVAAGGLNAAGGPIAEIARLSSDFRDVLATELRQHLPSLANGGREGFTESLPLAGEAPVTAPVTGAVDIQQFLARTNWLNRQGSPEAFAPHLLADTLPGVGTKRVIYQFARGDRTVPNPTSATLVRAGRLAPVSTLYRNDLTPSASLDPHGYLLNPLLAGYVPTQLQMTTFLASGGSTLIDPDGPLPVFETPLADAAELATLGFDPPPATGVPPPEQPVMTAAGATARGVTGVSPQGAGAGGAPLPATGAPAGLAVAAAMALGAAALLRRLAAASGTGGRGVPSRSGPAVGIRRPS